MITNAAIKPAVSFKGRIINDLADEIKLKYQKELNFIEPSLQKFIKETNANNIITIEYSEPNNSMHLKYNGEKNIHASDSFCFIGIFGTDKAIKWINEILKAPKKVNKEVQLRVQKEFDQIAADKLDKLIDQSNVGKKDCIVNNICNKDKAYVYRKFGKELVAIQNVLQEFARKANASDIITIKYSEPNDNLLFQYNGEKNTHASDSFCFIGISGAEKAIKWINKILKAPKKVNK